MIQLYEMNKNYNVFLFEINTFKINCFKRVFDPDMTNHTTKLPQGS